MFDNKSNMLYTQNQLEEVAKLAAEKAVKQVLQSNMNLENFTEDSVAISKGEVDMAKIKQKVTLPSGELIWITGNNMNDAIGNLLSRLSIGQPVKKNVPTLKEYGEKWYNLYHSQKVKWNTAQNTRIYLDKHIYPYLGNKKINEITHDDIQLVFNNMNTKARSTVEKVQITLNQIMKNAKEDGFIDNNVMDSSRYVMSKKVEQREALTISNIHSIIEEINKLDDKDRLLLSIILYTGLRRGEILALTWNDIDLENKIIHVKHSITFKNNQPVVCGTKSKAGVRDVPLIPELYSVLAQCQDKEGYIIKNNRDPELPMTEKSYQRTWERISKKIDLHGATAHIFRHTFATLMEPYTDVKTLQGIMGHADIKTTMNRYTHKIQENVKALSNTTAFR